MRHIYRYLFFLLILAMPYGKIVAQDTLQQQQYSPKISKKYSSNSLQQQSSIKSKEEIAIAKNHEEAAKRFSDKGDYVKAEQELQKALAIYARRKMTEDKARVSRSLAKAQEQQGKIREAIKNYEQAGNESEDKEQALVNKNDVNRLENSKNPPAQINYSNANLEIFKKQGNTDEIVDNYMQQAKTNTEQKNPQAAIENYNNALNTATGNTAEELKIKDELAEVYQAANQTDKAKEIRKEIISDAQQVQDVNTEIKQKQTLADLYFKEKNSKEGVRLLQESYDKAMANSNTIEAKKSLERLIDYYRRNGNYEKSIQLYDQFMKRLEQVIKSDSSLTDTQLLEATSEKIQQLENEKKLQDELIANQNTFNYFLIGVTILVIIFLGFLAKAFFSVKNKNKEIALQSLRREMNPHFIFNSLNSVNQFIAENRELEANKYLSSYSTLMRTIMENSNKDFISLSNEIELIKKYLDLEHLRFKEKFDYKLILDEKLDADATFIPNMVLQPQLENAIWHGLRYKNTKGALEVRFSLKDQKVRVEIEDDGIGLTKSKELKTLNQKNYTSRGLNNTLERIKLLNDLYKSDIQLNITERAGNGTTGTHVDIQFPLINKV